MSHISQPSYVCRCTEHDLWKTHYKEPSNPVYNLEKPKAVKQSTVTYLRNHGFLAERAKYLCKCCIEKVESLTLRADGARATGETDEFSSNHVLKFLNILEEESSETLFSFAAEETWERIMFLLGKKLLKQRMLHDGKQLSTVYKQTDKLIVINSEQFLSTCDKFLVKFLEGLSG